MYVPPTPGVSMVYLGLAMLAFAVTWLCHRVAAQAREIGLLKSSNRVLRDSNEGLRRRLARDRGPNEAAPQNPPAR